MSALSGTSQDATWTLGYNPAGQVVSRALSNSTYAYTADPNLSDTYTINGLNQVTAVDSTSIISDARGNITGDGQSEWNYDSRNRIVNGDYTGIDIGTYSYDPAGRMGRITAAGVNSRFVYAGGQAIGEYDASGGLIRRYVPGPGLDDYAAYTAGTGGSITRSWPMPDPLGSVTAITDGAGVATQINRYDEYGVPQAGFSGRFGYAGAMYLNRAMAAPWNMRNRQYNPTLGRFMQTDPIGIAGGVNLYAYVGGDPVNLVDPWGLQEGPGEPRIVPCGSAPHPSMIPGRCVATPEDCRIGGGRYVASNNTCVIEVCSRGATCYSAEDWFLRIGWTLDFVLGLGFTLEPGVAFNFDGDSGTIQACPYLELGARAGAQLAFGPALSIGGGSVADAKEGGFYMTSPLADASFTVPQGSDPGLFDGGGRWNFGGIVPIPGTGGQDRLAGRSGAASQNVTSARSRFGASFGATGLITGCD